MTKFIVKPVEKLEGEVRVGGAKNDILPLMAAALLAEEECIFNDVPVLRDVECMKEVIKTLGAQVEFTNNVMKISTPKIISNEAPYEYVSKMRSSFDVMGPLLARAKLARVPLPGGCAIGERPIDLHIKGFKALGAEIVQEHGYIEAKAEKLIGNRVYLDFPSVGATKNIMMAATRAEGISYIDNAAREPEIVDLANFLNKLGAKITGAGTNTIKIVGVEKMYGATHTVLSDRIVAGTYLILSAMKKSDVLIHNVEVNHLTPVIAKLRECGVLIEEIDDSIRVISDGKLKAVDITTLPYPGFPTDLQAQFMALLAIADGNSMVSETIFENRFLHVSELNRMGAEIKIEGHTAIIPGNRKLQGAKVKATDLRAGAALIMAGVCAKEGITEIYDIHHIDRGYNKIENDLRLLGVDIERVEE